MIGDGSVAGDATGEWWIGDAVGSAVGLSFFVRLVGGKAVCTPIRFPFINARWLQNRCDKTTKLYYLRRYIHPVSFVKIPMISGKHCVSPSSFSLPVRGGRSGIQ